MKLSKKKIILIAVLAVLAVLAVFVYNFIADINDPLRAFAGSLNQPDPTGIPEDVIASTPTPIPQPGETPAPSTPTPTIDPMEALAQQADAEYMKNVINILVLGMDKSAERENWGTFRTDTMILLSLNFDKNTIHMISIPRDSYVSIHGKTERGKINSAFSAGGGADKKGYEYAIKTVSNLFGGVKIHHYVGFDMNVVKEVINAMGGVDYDVDIEVSMNGRKLHPGQQHLDGQAVLDYCRQRKGSSDIARVDRQQRMLLAIFKQLKSTSQIANIPSIYQAVQSNIDTDLNFTQICSLALFADRVGFDDIQRHTLEGNFLNMNNISYWGISQSKKQKLVKEVFGFTCPIIQEEDVGYIKRELQERQERIDALVKTARTYEERAKEFLAGELAASLSQSERTALEKSLEALDGELASADDETLLQEAIDAMAGAFAPYIDVKSGSSAGSTEEIPEEEPAPDEDEEMIPEDEEIIPEDETDLIPEEIPSEDEIVIG